MTAPATQRALRNMAAAGLLMAGLAACGQRGPLTLPNDARPIERLEAPPGNADTDAETDDERENER